MGFIILLIGMVISALLFGVVYNLSEIAKSLEEIKEIYKNRGR